MRVISITLFLSFFLPLFILNAHADSKIGIGVSSKNVAIAKFSDISGDENNSPAKKAGLRLGDIIQEVNGEKVGNVADFRKIMKQTTPGISIPVKIERNGQEKTFQVKTVKNFTPEIDIVFDKLIKGDQVSLAIMVGDISNAVAAQQHADLTEWRRGIRSQLLTEVAGVYTQFKKMFKNFSLVTRSRINKVLEELNFQASDYIDESKSVQAGKLAGANLILLIDFSRTPRAQHEHIDTIAKRLINVSTGEILSSVAVKQYYDARGNIQKVE